MVLSVRFLLIWYGLFLVFAWQPRTVAFGAGTDVVRLANGDVLRGQIVRQDADGELLIAIRRAWLSEAFPQRADATAANENLLSRLALKQLVDRINTMLAEPAGRYDEGLVAFLRREQARAGELLQAAEPAHHQFMWVMAPAAEVRHVTRAEADHRQLVQWGWHEDLADAETLPRAKLTRLLKDRGVVATDRPPSLTDRLPPLPQDQAEWQARIALLEAAYGPPVTFQGTNDFVVRTDGEVRLESVLAIMKQMIGGELQSLFSLPQEDGHANSPTDRWLADARQQAADERWLRATRVHSLPDKELVDVESVFEVPLPDHGWVTVWRHQLQVDATTPRPAYEEQITADQQVGRALEALKSLGVFSNANLTKAIRFGAATVEAQQDIDRRFDAFNSTYTQRLDGPPLVW